MTPRAWSFALVASTVLWALILAVAALLATLLWPPHAASIEPWHDSIVLQSEFVAVGGADRVSLGALSAPNGESVGLVTPGPALSQPRKEVRSVRVLPPATVTPRWRPPSGAPTSRAGITEPSAGITGVASWYESSGGAAAGPALRLALGPGWRGTVVTVTANGFSVRTQLTDFMRADRLIDLDRNSAFAFLADPSRGLVNVTVEEIP